VGKPWSVVGLAISASNPDPVTLTDLHKLDVKGTIDFEVIYGLPGDLRYKLEGNKEFDFVIHQKNSVKPNPNIAVAVRDKS
jgi:hypothetical protein